MDTLRGFGGYVVDLQEAIKLYRRQGVVASQNKHLYRGVVSEMYPYELGVVVQSSSPVLNVTIKEVPQPKGHSSAAVHGIGAVIELISTTTAFDGALSPDFVQVSGVHMEAVLKTTTSYVDVTLQSENCRVGGVLVDIVLTPKAVDVVHRSNVLANNFTMVQV